MSYSAFIRLVRTSAWYDLLITGLFMTPWTFTWVYTQLDWVNTVLGLPGHTPPLHGVTLLLANLLGSVVVVWSLARLWHPSVFLGRLDAVARALFTVWQCYALAHGISAIIAVFTVVEIVFGLAQILPTHKATAVKQCG